MRIRNIRHKGLRRLAEEGDPSGLDPKATAKLDQMLTFLNVMEHEDELYSIAIWKAHKLTGDRKGTWSLFVTRNWRLTFWIDRLGLEIVDLDYVDYH